MVDKLVNSEINAKRIANVEYCFGMSGVPLGVCGRVLVGEGILTKICRKKPKSRQFFLFNDILVYGTILINKKKYTQQHIIPLEGLVVEDLPDEPVMKNGWLIKTSSKSFAVYAGSPSEKAEWIRHIKKCANDLLEQTGRTAPLEQNIAAVWVPDSIARICMHCKQSVFTILNRRHHCRKCGSVICGQCSKNRVVILHQSKYPVRICDTCFRKFYSHLNRAKKLSTGDVVENRNLAQNTNQISPESPNQSTLEQQEKKQLLDDENEIKQVVKECMKATIDEENRVESGLLNWIDLASEKITEHLKSIKNEDSNEVTSDNKNLRSISETLEPLNIDDEFEEVSNEKSNKEENKMENQDEQLEECKNDETFNNQTSDSEEEHNDLLSSSEDILEDEVHRKPTFYDLHLNEETIKEEPKDKNVQKEIDLTNGQIESNVKVENHDKSNVENEQTTPMLIITDTEMNEKINDEKDRKNVKNENKNEMKDINELKDQIQASL